MIKLYLYFLLFYTSKYRNILYIIFLIVTIFIYNINYSTPILFDDGTYSIPELEGDTYYARDISHNQPQRIYTAYNPNYVLTSEGYRTELPNNTVPYNFDREYTERIPNPSHYPSYNYPISSHPHPHPHPHLHPNEDVPVELPTTRANNVHFVGVSPTHSHFSRNEIFHGNDLTRYSIPKIKNNKGILSKLKKGYFKFESLMEKSILKEEQKRRQLSEYYEKTYGLKNITKGLSRAELEYLLHKKYRKSHK
jgi:hypothetical protein